MGHEKALQYSNKANAVTKGYNGIVFEGGACRYLLKEADYLLSTAFLVDVGDPLKIVPICRTFQSMRKLVDSCFGVAKLKGDVAPLLDLVANN